LQTWIVSVLMPYNWEKTIFLKLWRIACVSRNLWQTSSCLKRLFALSTW